MNDDTTEDESSKNGKKEIKKPLVEPVVTDQDLFLWLEKLFYDEPEVSHFPETIDVRLVSGKHNEKFGPFIWKKSYAPINASDEAVKKGAGTGKPTREQLVRLSNELLHHMQKDCDESTKPQTYGIHAWHFSTDSEPYTRKIRNLRPKGRYTAGQNGQSIRTEAEGDDEDDPLEKRFGKKILDHGETMFRLYTEALVGLVDRYHRDKERDSQEIDNLHTRLASKSEQLERALSLELDREERRDWSKIKGEGVKKALELGSHMFYPLLSKFGGPAAEQSAEVMTLKNFFKLAGQGGSLTDEQAAAAFGHWDEKGTIIKDGLLSPAQCEILVRVSNGQMHPDELDKLMPGGGPLAITMEQVAGMQEIFPMEQLAPILTIFQSRASKLASKK